MSQINVSGYNLIMITYWICKNKSEKKTYRLVKVYGIDYAGKRRGFTTFQVIFKDFNIF